MQRPEEIRLALDEVKTRLMALSVMMADEVGNGEDIAYVAGQVRAMVSIVISSTRFLDEMLKIRDEVGLKGIDPNAN